MPARLQKNPLAPRAHWLASAKRSLETEQQGMMALIEALSGSLGEAVADAVELIVAARGRVILSGMGKSGHIGRKIAATLASTGTPAMFVHPAEASHGDLGMITTHDVVIMMSNSGESAELRDMLAYTRRFAVPLIAMTTRADSTLAQEADVVLLLPNAREACPIGLAPTTSTMLQLALGDALAIALLEDKGFTAKDFREFHPGGMLGAQLKHVGDVMHGREELPLAKAELRMGDALLIMTARSFGCLGVTDANGSLMGIVTDGDLRRHMSKDLIDLRVEDVMTHHPKTIDAEALTGEALELLNSAKITSVFVVDAGNRPVGLVHIHDLLRVGVT
ncbi:MAG: KpsF/GutQ family sugar-phosphate isomerase [Rhizobiales bacterium]|nr:KpsF/GutQ family sugar-phosphate isomerase [Hyphomicrobiales bacterium]